MTLSETTDRSFFDESVGQSFIASAAKTINAYCPITPEAGQFEMGHSFKVDYPVAGVIGFISGDVAVTMLLAFDEKFILDIYETMVGEKLGSVSAEIEDCVAELTNILYGTAKAELSDKGFKFSMARPFPTRNINNELMNRKTMEIPFFISSRKRFSLLFSI